MTDNSSQFQERRVRHSIVQLFGIESRSATRQAALQRSLDRIVSRWPDVELAARNDPRDCTTPTRALHLEVRLNPDKLFFVHDGQGLHRRVVNSYCIHMSWLS